MRALLGALLVLLALPAAAPAAVTRPCPDDRSARCGSVLVPLVRATPEAGSLRVRFRVFPRSDRSRPGRTPIVAAEGGPGYSSIDSAEAYRFLLGPLRRRHDLIVVDNRGTGRSGAIDCPRLQAGMGTYSREVGRCARRLGAAANAYGTGAAADDLAAVLDALGIARVTVYGDSYGTYFAQAFAVRHPGRVRAVVLDAAFAVDGYDPWIREESVALRFAWPAVCERSPGCPADALATLSRLADRLEGRPLRGTSRDADGGVQRVKVDGSALGQMAGDASYYPTIYRDLLAAARAYERGDHAPLLRLAAEDLPFTGGGPVRSYSEGAFAAVACHDFPQVFDLAATVPERRAQLAAGRSLLAPDAYAPFANDVWLRSLYIHQYVTGCLEWPAPAVSDPPAPPGAAYPDVPVLVLVGDLDVITPLGDSRRAAALFPNATLVPVANVGHVTAIADFDGCASGIVRRFIDTLAPGDTGCAATRPEVHVVPRFPRTLAGAPGATRRERVAWAAAWTVGDAIARWPLMAGGLGHGLRGGAYTATLDYYSRAPVRWRLDRARFVRDLPVSGRAVWDRRSGTITARLTSPRLTIRWSTRRAGAIATVRGPRVRLSMPAP